MAGRISTTNGTPNRSVNGKFVSFSGSLSVFPQCAISFGTPVGEGDSMPTCDIGEFKTDYQKTWRAFAMIKIFHERVRVSLIFSSAVRFSCTKCNNISNRARARKREHNEASDDGCSGQWQRLISLHTLLHFAISFLTSARITLSLQPLAFGSL